jgi:seryl-tRNA synthetase
MLYEGDIRTKPEVVRAALRRRNAGAAEAALDEWLALDVARRSAATRRDALSSELRSRRRSDVHQDAQDASEAPHSETERELQQVQTELSKLEMEAREILLRLPNLPDSRVISGRGTGHYQELGHWRDPPAFSFSPRTHDELGATLGIVDLPRAVRLAGSRFPLLVGSGARLARTLAAFMLDLHAGSGYVEIAPPHLLRSETLRGTGHLPAHARDLYHATRDDLWLSPTAEAQLVALHAGETIPATTLPLAYTASTPAFRREAGSSRRASRGLLRQHQFDKVELVRITTPEDTDNAFERLVADAGRVLEKLEIPYRLVALPAGDLPFSSRRTYDLEAWMPGQGGYVEISSVSDCGSFQTRRLNMRYQPAGGARSRYPHTLNASALPIGRTIAALLENGQRSDGSVALPEALATYLPERVLEPSG